MVGIDTNVLVRLLVLDDRTQTRRARQLVQRALARGEAVWVSLLVLLETEWVLRSRYGLGKAAVLDALVRMLESAEFSFEDESAVEEALHNWRRSSCGFSDCLIVAHNRRLGCGATCTFDRQAARLPGARAA